MMLRQREQLDQWIAAHKEHFISHAIWADNIDGVITAGRLEPAEMQLRKKRIVSYEAGEYNHRYCCDISKLMDDPQFRSVKPLVEITEARDFIPGNDIAKYLLQLKQHKHTTSTYTRSYLDEDDFVSPDNPAVKLADGKIYPLNAETDEYRIFGIPSLKLRWRPEIDRQNTDSLQTIGLIAARYQISMTQYLTRIVCDELSPNPIDKRLAAVWNSYTKLSFQEDLSKLYTFLYAEARANEIPLNSISHDIRATYNRISWGYGDVVVLCGNINDTVNYFSKRHKLHRGYEVSLRSPFENDGEFFTLPLNQANTIVLGPQSILSRYETHAREQGIRLFFIERLTLEQMDFFEVPAKLRPLSMLMTLTSPLFIRRGPDKEEVVEERSDITRTRFSVRG